MLNDRLPAEPTRRSWGFFESLVTTLGLVLTLCNFYVMYRTDKLTSELRAVDASTQAQLTTAREVAAATTTATRRVLDNFEERLNEVKGISTQANTKAAQAQSAARRQVEQVTGKLAAEQRRQQQELIAQLGEMKEAHASTTEKVSGLLSDVSTVRTEVSQTKNDLDRTVGDLKSVRGDLGVQSGLIATNSRELAALRALGERNYYEFDLPKTAGPQRIANIALRLKKSDIKRNRFTLEVIADDKTVEKKDRTINEPVQFYTSQARQPYELVINEVKANRIVGYLATPKTLSASR